MAMCRAWEAAPVSCEGVRAMIGAYVDVRGPLAGLECALKELPGADFWGAVLPRIQVCRDRVDAFDLI